MSVVVLPSPDEWAVLQRLGFGDRTSGIVVIMPPDVQAWIARELAQQSHATAPDVVARAMEDAHWLAERVSSPIDYETDDADLWVDVACGASEPIAMPSIRDLYGLPQPAGVCSVGDAAGMLDAGTVTTDAHSPAEIRYHGWTVRAITRVHERDYQLVLDGAAPVHVGESTWIELFDVASPAPDHEDAVNPGEGA